MQKKIFLSITIFALCLGLIASGCSQSEPDKLLEEAYENYKQENFQQVVNVIEKLQNKYPEYCTDHKDDINKLLILQKILKRGIYISDLLEKQEKQIEEINFKYLMKLKELEGEYKQIEEGLNNNPSQAMVNHNYLIDKKILILIQQYKNELNEASKNLKLIYNNSINKLNQFNFEEFGDKEYKRFQIISKEIKRWFERDIFSLNEKINQVNVIENKLKSKLPKEYLP